jgi:hypothetical protein
MDHGGDLRRSAISDHHAWWGPGWLRRLVDAVLGLDLRSQLPPLRHRSLVGGNVTCFVSRAGMG